MIYHFRLTQHVFAGTAIVYGILLILLMISSFQSGSSEMIVRLAIGIALLPYFLITFLFLRKQLYSLVAWSLLLLYGGIAIFILITCGINMPTGILILGFVIFLSAILLGSKFILPITIICNLAILFIHILIFIHAYKPANAALSFTSTLSDVIIYATMFSIFAVLAWISRRTMEQSLNKALAAEQELKKEKEQLALKVAEQTEKLRLAQKEEMLQFYRFAELGQLTTIILHDLANNLSVLSLDIDDFQTQVSSPEVIDRTKESISYLENIVNKIRQQLHRSDQAERFDLIKVINETVSEYRAKSYGAIIHFKTAHEYKKLYNVGDPLRLSQILGILLNNAVEATLQNDNLRQIEISTKKHSRGMRLSVIDYGVGVPEDIRDILFEPLRSTKQNGLGMGLFVAKQIIETHFKGTLSLSPARNYTEFLIEIPLVPISKQQRALPTQSASSAKA